jgi:hypothetical protein
LFSYRPKGSHSHASMRMKAVGFRRNRPHQKPCKSRKTANS